MTVASFLSAVFPFTPHPRSIYSTSAIWKISKYLGAQTPTLELGVTNWQWQQQQTLWLQNGYNHFLWSPNHHFISCCTLPVICRSIPHSCHSVKSAGIWRRVSYPSEKDKSLTNCPSSMKLFGCLMRIWFRIFCPIRPMTWQNQFLKTQRQLPNSLVAGMVKAVGGWGD